MRITDTKLQQGERGERTRKINLGSEAVMMYIMNAVPADFLPYETDFCETWNVFVQAKRRRDKLKMAFLLKIYCIVHYRKGHGRVAEHTKVTRKTMKKRTDPIEAPSEGANLTRTFDKVSPTTTLYEIIAICGGKGKAKERKKSKLRYL
jgi:hypothetical protein